MIATFALGASLILAGTPAGAVSAATSPAAGASAEAGATRTVSFRGLVIRIPAAWKTRKEYGELRVTTGACSKRAAECPGFSLKGPQGIKYAYEGGPYRLGQPYHPSTGVMECVPVKKYMNGALPTRPARSMNVEVGGVAARFTEWRLPCVTQQGKPTSASYTQRVWYLKAKKVLVVDHWRTPGLAKILKNAVWSG
ncbi:hypothetical protein [Planobispora longispora]|nr:hypothetical protein [Planobispora longispora]